MRSCLFIWFFIVHAVLTFNLDAFAEGITIDDYRNGLASGWEKKTFKGETLYHVTREDGRDSIKAISNSSASGLYYKISYSPKDYPILAWEWKVDHVLKKGDALKKEGDDYAARLYVVFPSIFFWKTKALNYIWASRLPFGEAVPNPFTGNAIMIAVESGSEYAGQWRKVKRNVYEDFVRYFGQDPPDVGAIAIMTDTDNTGEHAVAWYGPIRILPAPAE